jgi:hypothetical protein
MKKYSSWKLSVLTFALLGAATSSYAQWAVIDPTNLIQTTITAGKAIRTEVNTATAAIQNIKQTINLVKSIKNINNLSSISDMQKEMLLYSQLKDSDAQLIKSIDDTARFSMDIKAQYGASNGSWQKFFENTTKGDFVRAKAMQTRYQNLNQSIETSNARRKDIMGQFAVSDGSIAAASQATTASVDNMSGQVSQLVSYMSYQTALQAGELNKETQEKVNSNDIWTKRQADLKNSADRYNLPYVPAK